MNRRALALAMAKKCRERIDKTHVSPFDQDHEALAFMSGFCSALETVGIDRTDIPLDVFVMASLRGYADTIDFVIENNGEGRLDGAVPSLDKPLTPFSAECEAFTRDIAQLPDVDADDCRETLAALVTMAAQITRKVRP